MLIVTQGMNPAYMVSSFERDFWLSDFWDQTAASQLQLLYARDRVSRVLHGSVTKSRIHDLEVPGFYLA